jgi:hypothetical protein
MSVYAQATALMSDGVPVRQVALRLGVPEDLVMAMATMANPKARGTGQMAAPSPCGGCPVASACSGTGCASARGRGPV